jgi:hypothetical protein
VPYAFFVSFFADEGIGLPTFVEGVFANGAAGGFAADVLISSAVFWSYMFSRRDGPSPWPVVAVNLLIGLSCALPLYLYLSRRRASAGRALAATA